MSVSDEWQSLPLDTDPQVVMGRILDDLQQVFGPDWEAHPSAPEVALAEELGTEAATLAAARVRDADLHAAWLGAYMLNLPIITGAPATIPATVTTTATGVLVRAGLTVLGVNDDGIDVAFLVAADVLVASTTTAIVLVARDAGIDGNGVPAGPLRILNTTAGVLDITATAASSGGIDPETLVGYLSRFRDYAADLSPGGVRGPDLARLARSTPGVQRALAIDLLDATDPASDPVTKPSERTVTIYPLDATGAYPGAATQADLAARIAAVREVNFIVRVAAPTYTAVTIAFDGVAEDPDAAAAVRLEVIAALRTYLDPARWGGTARADASLPTDWTARRVVRYLDVVRVAGSVDGLAILNSITVNSGTADVTLPGRAPLPSTSSTINGTVA